MSQPIELSAAPSDKPDLLFGADAIARELGLGRRQVYHLIENDHLPSFRIGGTLCARRSSLSRFFEELERR